MTLATNEIVLCAVLGVWEVRTRSLTVLKMTRRNDQRCRLQRGQLMSGGNSFLLWFRVAVEVTVDAEFNHVR